MCPPGFLSLVLELHVVDIHHVAVLDGLSGADEHGAAVRIIGLHGVAHDANGVVRTLRNQMGGVLDKLRSRGGVKGLAGGGGIDAVFKQFKAHVRTGRGAAGLVFNAVAGDGRHVEAGIGAAVMRIQAVRPSISGIMMSEIIKSGCFRAISSMAS